MDVGSSDNCPLSVGFGKRIKIGILLNKTVNTKSLKVISTEATLWATFMGLVAVPHS